MPSVTTPSVVYFVNVSQFFLYVFPIFLTDCKFYLTLPLAETML